MAVGCKVSKSEICSKNFNFFTLFSLEGGHSGPVGWANGPPIGWAVRVPIRRTLRASVGWAASLGSPTGENMKIGNLKFSTLVNMEGDLAMAHPTGRQMGHPSVHRAGGRIVRHPSVSVLPFLPF